MASRLSCVARATCDGHLVLVAGDIDAATSAQLGETLGQFANGSLTVDLSRVTFCDSSGLRVLIEAEERIRRRSGTLTLRSPSPCVAQVLDIAGLGDRLRLAEA